MWRSFNTGRIVRGAIPPALCVIAIVYFGVHAVQGDRGLIALVRLQDAIARTEAELARTRALERHLARRVAMMQPHGIDRDLLDEYARDALGLMHRDEVLIYLRPEDGP